MKNRKRRRYNCRCHFPSAGLVPCDNDMARGRRALSGDLTCDGCLGLRLLLPPQWDEHSDVAQPFVPKPVYCQLKALARKHPLVAMATKKTQKPESTNMEKKNFFFWANVHIVHIHASPFFQEVDGVARMLWDHYITAKEMSHSWLKWDSLALFCLMGWGGGFLINVELKFNISSLLHKHLSWQIIGKLRKTQHCFLFFAKLHVETFHCHTCPGEPVTSLLFVPCNGSTLILWNTNLHNRDAFKRLRKK